MRHQQASRRRCKASEESERREETCQADEDSFLIDLIYRWPLRHEVIFDGKTKESLRLLIVDVLS